ncbi:MAG: hypothetical protein J7L47_02725, partial [Candidatus Odinarchaeota archaeon]|nr:hypothetical protein [Candidatus Odinarchaeota archaeon]
MSRADRKESESGYIFLRYVFPLILFLPFIVEVAMDTVSLFIGSVTCILFGTISYPESFAIVTSAVYGSRALSMFFSSFNYETIHLFEPASESNPILVGTYGLISFLYIVYVLFSVVEFLIGPRNLNLRRKYLQVLYIS